MKLFLLLLFISVGGLKTGFSQAAQNQARQVITLRLMPVNTIELPAASDLHKIHPIPRKWLIHKQQLAVAGKKAPSPGQSNKQSKNASRNIEQVNPIVYTITCL